MVGRWWGDGGAYGEIDRAHLRPSQEERDAAREPPHVEQPARRGRRRPRVVLHEDDETATAEPHGEPVVSAQLGRHQVGRVAAPHVTRVAVDEHLPCARARARACACARSCVCACACACVYATRSERASALSCAAVAANCSCGSIGATQPASRSLHPSPAPQYCTANEIFTRIEASSVAPPAAEAAPDGAPTASAAAAATLAAATAAASAAAPPSAPWPPPHVLAARPSQPSCACTYRGLGEKR
eukprot:scaffold106734_cov63-Phaeocystis_antarctica.AAC.1